MLQVVSCPPFWSPSATASAMVGPHMFSGPMSAAQLQLLTPQDTRSDPLGDNSPCSTMTPSPQVNTWQCYIPTLHQSLSPCGVAPLSLTPQLTVTGATPQGLIGAKHGEIPVCVAPPELPRQANYPSLGEHSAARRNCMQIGRAATVFQLSQPC